MKLNILSDIHLEFGGLDHRAPPDCDAVILAGDIGVGYEAVRWAASCFKGTDVFYVPGNHELYGQDMDRFYAGFATECENHGVHSLHNRKYETNGCRFIGATLWTDFNLYGEQCRSMREAARSMNDYGMIVEKNGAAALSAARVLREHEHSLRLIEGWLSAPFDGKTIVVTHHAPSEWSADEEDGGDPMLCYYASSLEDLIRSFQPDLWIHGHLHHSNDYRIGRTRVISNPRGYVGHALNPDFEPDLVVQVGGGTLSATRAPNGTSV
ncbi:metallophosphoesterase [Caldimonas tepidiphila]|uniref:metallophosphoesterase n=1 Tax=Caldimonas tepidiphila TaxID=2315841 RepID=UPI000E5A297D|nr:metallophosphoesterase [Caldimonas tepidiphila]